MSPVKGVKRPKGVNWLVESRIPAPKGGEQRTLRSDVRQPRDGEVLDLAVGSPESIAELRRSYRAKRIETKRAASGTGEDVLIAYVPEKEYQTPTQQFVEEGKSFFSHLLERRK